MPEPVTLARLVILLQARAAPDTTLTIRGILVEVEETSASPATWALQLLQPIAIGQVRTNAVELAGSARRWARYSDRYVEARGRVTIRPGARFAAQLQVDRLTPTTPPGMVQRNVRLSHSQHAFVSLAVVPNRIALGRGSGEGDPPVRPVVLYSLANIGNTDLEFYFQSSKAVCVGVEPSAGGPLWEDPTELRPGTAETVVIRIGVVFRQILPLPRDATPAPGSYTVRVSLCGVIEYELTATLQVDAI